MDEKHTVKQIQPELDELVLPQEIRSDLFELVETQGQALWERTQISRRERSLITLAVCSALGLHGTLREHVRLALNEIGLSREEVCEAIYHVTFYAGVPQAINALHTAAKQMDNAVEQGGND